MGDVEVGVQPQLGEAPADAGDAREHLLAHHPEHLLQRLVLTPSLVLGLLRVAILALDAKHHASEQIRAPRVERLGCRAAQLEEAPDALARVRRDLGRLDRGRERRHHVQLAPPRQRDHAREVDLAQLDRRARERAHDRGGVVGVGEQAHPGEHIAHLRALAEGGRAAFLAQCVARGRRDLRGGRHRPRIRVSPGRGHGSPYALRMGSDAIDWGAAQRIGELIAGSPPRGEVGSGAIEPLAHDFAARVSAYTGLQLEPARLPPLEVVDRPAWIAANLRTMKPLLDPLTARFGGNGDDSDDEGSGGIMGIVSGPLRAASGLLLGAQVGALTGMLSQRVLGQYDLALLDEQVQPRLLLLGPESSRPPRATSGSTATSSSCG